MSVTGFSIFQLRARPSKIEMQANGTAAINLLRTRLSSYLLDPVAWQNTVSAASNSQLAQCIANGGNSCSFGSNRLPFVLYDAQNNVAFDGTSNANGFTSVGSLCNTFNSRAGSGSDSVPTG